MARASRRVRKDRRMRRERNLALRMAEHALVERNQSRHMIKYLVEQINKRDKNEVATDVKDDQADRPNENNN